MVSKPELFETTKLSISNSIRFFCLCGWMKSEVYKNKGGYMKRIARLRFGCSCLRKEM